MRIACIIVALVALVACGGPVPTSTPIPTPTPDSSRLTAERVIAGLPASGTIRIGDSGAKVSTTPTGLEEHPSLILYVGPSVILGYLLVAPPGWDMNTVRDNAIASLKAQPQTTPRTYLVAQDRNAVLILSPLQSANPENDRAIVEAALKAVR